MSQLNMKSIFTRDSAAPVYAAAMGAARIAESADKKELAEKCLVLARQFRSVCRYGPESHVINAFGVEPVKAAEVPPQFAAVAKEIARTGAWVGDCMLVGYLERSDGGGRRLYAKAYGKGVRYTAEPDVKPKAQRDADAKAAKEAAAIKERARLAKRTLEREDGPGSPVVSAVTKKATAKRRPLAEKAAK